MQNNLTITEVSSKQTTYNVEDYLIHVIINGKNLMTIFNVDRMQLFKSGSVWFTSPGKSMSITGDNAYFVVKGEVNATENDYHKLYLFIDADVEERVTRKNVSEYI
jgi:hypothetical protein